MSAHQLLAREVLDLVDDEPLAADHPAAAHEEHLHRGLELVVDEADHVEVLRPLGHHLLLLDGLAHSRQAVAEPGRLLELERRGRLGHAGLELLDHRVGVAVEEVEELLHEHVVVGLRRSPPRTGRSTARCGTAGTADRAAGAGRTCCRSRSATGRCAAAGRASRGWRRRGRRARSSGRPCACGPASPWAAATRRRG